ADGKLRACLHSKNEVDLREALRNGSTDQDVLELLAQSVWRKPAQHHMNNEAWQGKRVMSQIGG
ncbi:MAG: GTP 3',8-cyclase MoaA, partial [Bacillota bacterium]|nr:GTP 3',8-cyclase MoaA [Bacillota bacterium]